MRILLVEDDLALAEMYRIGLEHAGYRVTLATDGPAGFQEATTAPPDLLLVDIRLPGFDGFQLIQRLRDRADTRDLPAVVLSNFGSDEMRDRGLELGMLGHFVKADTPPGILRDWIESWRAAHDDEAAASGH